jgi:hypothetical protein
LTGFTAFVSTRVQLHGTTAPFASYAQPKGGDALTVTCRLLLDAECARVVDSTIQYEHIERRVSDDADKLRMRAWGRDSDTESDSVGLLPGVAHVHSALSRRVSRSRRRISRDER